MKSRILMNLLSLGAVSLLSAADFSRIPDGISHVSPDIAPYLINTLSFDSPLGGNPSFVVSEKLNIILKFDDTYKENRERKLVMVSANKYTVLGHQIQTHPDAKLILDQGDYFVKVLFDVSGKNAFRDELAMASHEDIGACGGMVPLALLDESQLTDAIPPVHSTAATIDSVKSTIALVSSTNIKSTVATLEGLGSRYHAGSNAALAVSTIKSLWQAQLPSGATIAESSNGSSSSQNNLVVTIPGTVDTASTVIVGAHLDSINRSDNSNAPGADDDATGIATLTEMLRVIKTLGITFQRTVEFHAYAGEEVGLVGSSTLAKAYATAGKKVVGQMQMDMNGYANAESSGTIFLVTTDTSAVLRKQLKELISGYSISKWQEMVLTAGSSDHRSWTKSGFHAVFPFENPSAYNKSIHSSADSSSILDFNQSASFGKLGLAWVAHAAGTNATVSDFTKNMTALSTAGDDLKIGVIENGASGQRLIASGPETVATIASCTVESATAAGCIKNVRVFSTPLLRDGRTFFEDEADQTLTSGLLHRFTAYDSNGKVVAERTIKLKQLN
ncbi:MAG: M20/M25/M40 family metallo-hydrolase [Proteobacteria bacterium]|nr:M20/M25/M40 family metallo-hydrolase [Pseudomonadota bacterium]